MSKLKISEHAYKRLAERFGKSNLAKPMRIPYDKGYTLIARTPRGSWRLVDISPQDLAVIIVRERTIVTFLTVEMAFADIPMAVFLSLCKHNRLDAALRYRAQYKMDELPKAKAVKVTYPIKKAELLWRVFRWSGRK